MDKKERLEIIEKSAWQVGRPIFFSVVIMILSFLPVFLLTGREGKLFHPLAWTKTFAMIGSAFLAITLVPLLMTFFMRGKLRPEHKNPVTKFFESLYKPLIHFCLKWKKTILAINLFFFLAGIPILLNMGTEFMPHLDEGTILFMPITLPEVSNTEVKRILQVQDKILKNIPEVENVLGKAGRAMTATDNAPISMIETIVLLKPKSQWRKEMTMDKLIAEMDAKLQIPGVINGWTQPIINRINMLSTGVRTDVGVKVYGNDLNEIYDLSRKIQSLIKDVNGVEDLSIEQVIAGKYLDIDIKREEIGRYGLSIDDVQMVIETALGGMNLSYTIEGRKRFPLRVRFSKIYRDNVESIKRILINTPSYGTIPLSAVADVNITEGPSMINSENAMLRGTVIFNIRGRDMGSTVKEVQNILQKNLTMPAGYYLQFSGEYEHQQHAKKRFQLIIPIVLVLIFMFLYYTYRQWKEAVVTSLSVPFALVGGVYLLWFYGINISVAVVVGFIALFGIAVETGVIMVVYLDEALQKLVNKKGTTAITKEELEQAVIDGSVLRVRPKLMTVGTTMIGLLPILWSQGTGSDVMIPIAVPIIGGLITSTIHVLLVTPLIFQLVKENEIKKHGKVEVLHAKVS